MWRLPQARPDGADYLRQAGLLDSFSPLEALLRGLLRELTVADEKRLLGRMAALIHVEDPEHAEAYSMLSVLMPRLCGSGNA